MVNFIWTGVTFLILGLIAVLNPDILKPLYGWTIKVMGGKVTPPKNFSIQYKITGGIFIILGLFLLYNGLK